MRTAPGGFRDRAERVEDDREGLAGRDQLEKPSLTGKQGLGEAQVRNCHIRHSTYNYGPHQTRRQSYLGIAGRHRHAPGDRRGKRLIEPRGVAPSLVRRRLERHVEEGFSHALLLRCATRSALLNDPWLLRLS